MALFVDHRNPYRPKLPDVLRLAPEDFEFAISAENEEAIGRSAEWSVMAYLAADCDLAAFMFDDLMEMNSVASDASMHVCALFDGPLVTDAFFARLTGGAALRDDFLLRWPELRTNSPATLENALTLHGYFPGKRRVLFLGGHGNGWRGMLIDENLGLAQRVEKTETAAQCDARTMRCLEAAQACLDRRLQAAPAPANARWDVLAIDACEMGNIETIGFLARQADILVVSEDLVPGDGYPYDRVLRDLRANLAQSPVDFARNLVGAAQAHYRGTGRGGRAITQVALKADGLPAFADALMRLAQSLAGAMAEETVFRAVDYAIHMARRFRETDSIDLVGFVGRLLEHPLPDAIRGRCAAVLEAWASMVIASAVPGTLDTANGLAIYAPLADGEFDPAYVELSNGLELGLGIWPWFLASYYQRALGDRAEKNALVATMRATMQDAVERGVYRPGQGQAS